MVMAILVAGVLSSGGQARCNANFFSHAFKSTGRHEGWIEKKDTFTRTHPYSIITSSIIPFLLKYMTAHAWTGEEMVVTVSPIACGL